MADRTKSALEELEKIKTVYGDGSGERKLALLRELEGRSLRRPVDVLGLHETLCFLRAYPDDAPVLAQVERMLRGFARRSDLRRHRRALDDTGIEGTEIHYSFYAQTAIWLARRCGRNLTIEWGDFENERALDELLPQIGLYGEGLGLEEFDFGVRGWIDRMKGPEETDAGFLLRRLERLPMSTFVLETTLEGLDIPYRLTSGRRTPSRTREMVGGTPIAYQATPLRRSRPAVSTEVRRKPRSVRVAPPGEGRRLIDLARGAMVTRARDLDAFAYGDPNDVRIVDWGEGLSMCCNGTIPERRFLLETLYGFLMLKNGVPVGYGTYTALFHSAEVAFTIFPTYRGSETAWMYGRVLAAARHLLGCDAFTIDPYQIGHENEDAVRSGAWWFYQKLGFRPRSASLRKVMRREEGRMRANRAYRSSPATLRLLATDSLCLDLGPPRDDVVGIFPAANVGLKITEYLGERFGYDRRKAERVCAREAARLLGVRSMSRFTRGERLAWRRWSPLILILPGVERWSREDRRNLVAIVRAKGGRHESDYVLRIDRHRRLRRAIRRLAGP